MNLQPLSARSDSELVAIADLARETSIGSALFDHGLNLEDLKADPVGHILLSTKLDEVDRLELVAWWQRFLITGCSVMSISNQKTMPVGW